MLPLITGGETIGMMEVVDEVDRQFDPADVDFCQALCNVVAPAVQNAMLYQEMKELAARDKLTGLYNRRLFEEQFDAAVARSQRNGEQLSLLVVDLDGLKRIKGPYSFSGGVARAATNLGASYDLYRSADIAAYRAKAAGGARTLLGVESRAVS
jgi:GGDEF domain-containing protein